MQKRIFDLSVESVDTTLKTRKVFEWNQMGYDAFPRPCEILSQGPERVVLSVSLTPSDRATPLLQLLHPVSSPLPLSDIPAANDSQGTSSRMVS
jgi:hypothetical protein